MRFRTSRLTQGLLICLSDTNLLFNGKHSQYILDSSLEKLSKQTLTSLLHKIWFQFILVILEDNSSKLWGLQGLKTIFLVPDELDLSIEK